MANKKILLPCALLLLCSGCWDYREMDSLSIVAGAALDVTPEGLPCFTAELADLQQPDVVAPQILTGTGESFLAAGMHASGQTGRELYFGHAQSVVISQQLAQEGVGAALDYISRQNDNRLSLHLMVSREETAAAILQAQPATEQLGSFELSLQAKQEGEKGTDMPFYKFYSELKAPGIDPFLPAVSVKEGEKQAQEAQQGKDQAEENTPTTQLDGVALFRGDSLCGFLDEQQAQILMMLRDNYSGGLMTVQRPMEEGGDVTFAIDECRRKIQVEVAEDSQIRCTLRLAMEVRVSELQGDQGILSEEMQQQVTQLCEEQVKEQAEFLLVQLQHDYGSDTIGLGLTLSRYEPDAWQDMQENWYEWFSKAQFQVDVDANITGTGRTYLPATRGIDQH